MKLQMHQGRLKLTASESIITEHFLFLFHKTMSPIFNHIPISHEVHVKIKSLRAKRFRAEIKVLDSDCRATLFSSDFSMNPNTLITVLAEDVVNSLEIKKIQEGDSIQYMEFIET